MSLADELERLEQLRQSGAIDEEEFSLAKTRILNGSPQLQTGKPAYDAGGGDAGTLEADTRRWGFLLHLSVLAGFALPIAGLVVPIIIWQLKKPILPGIDVHGVNAVNWIISLMIYTLVSALLVLALIGIPLLIALGLVSIIFPIIAAIKANNGEVWKYPLSISFLKCMVDLSVSLGRITLSNPVLVASGTFGYVREMASFVRLERLGGVIPKTVTFQPRPGNPTPRTVETASGMLNAIGLDNDGIHHFISHHLPYLRTVGTAVIPNIAGEDEDQFVAMAEMLVRRPASRRSS